MPDPSPGMPDAGTLRVSLFDRMVRLAKYNVQSRDLTIMRYIFDLTRGGRGERGAILVSKLGNGWLYLFLLPAAVFELPERRLAGLLAAAANLAASHSIYPWLKRRTRRPRPFDLDPSLISTLPARDQYSFPSGHTMTLAAALTPFAYLDPGFWAPGVAMVLVMAWARVASGHHYPTDVCAGASLGGMMGLVISFIFLRS